MSFCEKTITKLSVSDKNITWRLSDLARKLQIVLATPRLKTIKYEIQDYRIAPEIKKSLMDLGYKKPTDIQFKAIPNILRGEDVLAIAQTGTGKTAAFAIPILDMLYRNRPNRFERGSIRALVMVPKRTSLPNK